ncbi:glycoside hydrolase family 3 C-terminal domain-containing protein [Thermophilibacter sp. ET337]|uniref:glycoside hydrolase family 3 C-terminal domain-containing protein n=1 Tax=Thermophilibacter sp. ET337 TaxID=2973084 RepID=UPI0021ACE924|nr:glycoside hydrolase family 3 C-terminal domain-containing protein [Thermophilibacter sp. ET337]MCR8907191.1 glycoside hydrolase family 3 C-terminal domain-containing protein [Thermophilibacter sp. ET337]
MRHADIIAKLTLEQKCVLLQGAKPFGTWPLDRAGVPQMEFSDGPSGVRHQAGEHADHLGLSGSEPATCFPTAVTMANTWDEELEERVGAAMGQEAAVQKVGTLLAPGLCIKRNPLCGRNFEYFSEDPLVSGKMAAAFVRGVQSNGIAACPKHFAVNSQETRRQASDSVLDERTLREIYLAGFETVVRESAPQTIMTSYNLVNGTYANENKHLLKDILRDEWGFDGAVVTDWGGSNDHAAGVAAGSTFEMPAPGLGEARQLIEAVRSGRLAEKDVDERVDEAIELVLATRAGLEAAPAAFDAEAHHALAREAAAEGCVLLKNEGGLLPLAPRTRVALIGDFAKTPRYQGAGSSAVNSTKVVSLLEAMGETDLELVGYEPGFERHGGESRAKLDAAVDLARRAEVVLLALGLDEVAETEGAERRTMALNANQVELLHAVAQVNPRIVVLLSAGSCVETDWVSDAPAILYCALGGQAGAGGALDVVTGAVCPSGKLTETWPRRLADVPSSASYPAEGLRAEYREGLYVGYRYFQTAHVPVAFPFGFGLSYTNFAYSDLKATDHGATFTVTNTGSCAGAEVAQLYVAKPEHEVFRPEQELRGFAKVELAPGESRTVEIALNERAFSYFNVATGRWEVEGGTYELRVGASSEDVRLVGRVTLAGTGAPDPYADVDVTPYETARVKHVSDASFAALLGRPVPDDAPRIEPNMCFRDLNHGRSAILWAVWLVLRSRVRAMERSGVSDINTLFIWNMPLRAMGIMTGGITDKGVVDALLREVRGFGWGGAVLLVLALALGWGPLVGCLLWLAWIVVPLVGAVLLNLVRNAALARKL